MDKKLTDTDRINRLYDRVRPHELTEFVDDLFTSYLHHNFVDAKKRKRMHNIYDAILEFIDGGRV